MSFPKYLLSLEEARQVTDGYVVIDGDYGGICYLVCPARLVVCDERTLLLLAHELEEAIFPSSTEGGSVRYTRLALDEELSGFALGEESAIALNTLWVPKWLSEGGLDSRIRRILAGKLASLNLSLSEQVAVKTLHTEYSAQKFRELTSRST